jgi:two-component system osmolarity sensor histidine kinase EnvZ
LVEPRLPLRIVTMLLVALGLLLAVNWRLARTLSRPLERLRQRIDDPTRAIPATPAGTAEMATIEAAWEAAQARLAEQARERSLLLAGVSHDLRSPLARIRMAAELLPDGDATLAARRDTITRNVSVADQLLQSFLDHVRAGELPLDEQVDLAEHARAAVRAMDRPTTELRIEAPAHLWLAPANGVLIDRVIANLLDNAFQHGQMPVTLRLYRAVDAPATVCLEVIDTGPGIPPAQQAEALRAFGRGDTSRQRPGTGLGLAVVRQVVERLGGEIRFQHTDGLHTVQLRLPVRPLVGR